MSSPIASKQKKWIDKALINVHQSLSHNHRVAILSDIIFDEIKALYPNPQEIKVLDMGCGDMSIIGNITKKAEISNWVGMDIYELPESMKETPLWEHYRQFDTKKIDFPDDYFDVGLFSDVLHHIPESERLVVISEAARVCKYLIIKDHFEHGLVSRHILRMMDFVGNYGYGVSVPQRYFDNNSFVMLLQSANLHELSRRSEIDLYGHLTFIKHLLKPNLQFISVLKTAS